MKTTKKTYIRPCISVISLGTDPLLGATSWIDPDGNHHPVNPVNPDTPDEPDEDVAPRRMNPWTTWDEVGSDNGSLF